MNEKCMDENKILLTDCSFICFKIFKILQGLVLKISFKPDKKMKLSSLKHTILCKNCMVSILFLKHQNKEIVENLSYNIYIFMYME